MASQTQSAMQLATKILQPLNDAVIHVYDEAGNVIKTHKHTGEFEEL